MNYYRNSIAIGIVEAHCLWQLINEEFVLIDDDEYVTVPYKDYYQLFYKIE